MRGHIRWSRTLQERLKTGLVDIPLFATARRERDFDTKENQLFRFMLDQLAQVAAELIAWADSEKYWVETVHGTFKMVRRHRASRLLDGVQSIDRPDSLHIRAANAARNKSYRSVAALYELFSDLVLDQDLQQLYNVLKAQYLDPMQPEDLFELYTLFEVGRSLRLRGWEETEQHLIGGDKGIPAFCFLHGETIAKVLYQRVPGPLRIASQYKAVLGHYESLRGLRRPDVIIRLENLRNRRSKYVLVEAKYSRNRGYIVDGAYKLFGYLSDFQNALRLDVRPTGILVAMSGVEPRESFETLVQDPILLVNKGLLRDTIGRVVDHHKELLAS